MWICLNNAFFSIVADNDDVRGDRLLVRARREGDIEAVFGADADHTPERDYAYRTWLPREQVAEVIRDQALGIDYPNFKNSVDDPELHNAYSRVWTTLWTLQRGG